VSFIDFEYSKGNTDMWGIVYDADISAMYSIDFGSEEDNPERQMLLKSGKEFSVSEKSYFKLIEAIEDIE
jgi:hypothetical protein